ncbi:hypothetical protein BDB13_3643 [Rhodococcus sp. OK302]|nr:hypothetical protein BDB13_3643 [Rhodococcus sp. OK302]
MPAERARGSGHHPAGSSTGKVYLTFDGMCPEFAR